MRAPARTPEPEPAAPPPATRSPRTWLDPLVAAVCALFVFLQLRPDLLFSPSTPTVGDLGAHVWGPQFLQAHLFDRGLLAGWSNDWFGGFPAYRFYMPVPALGAVVLHLVFSYGTALKLMVALPLVVLPFVAWRFGRAARLPAHGAAFLSIASLLVLFDGSNVKFGGSIASTVAGEYGNTLGLVLALWCFAVFAEDDARKRRGPAAGVLGGLAACCHPIALFFVVVGLIALVGGTATTTLDRAVAQLPQLARTLGLTLLLSAFWYVPFVAFRLYTTDLDFNRVTGLHSLLFPLPWPVEIVLLLLFVAGVVDAVLEERAAVMGLAFCAVAFALAAYVMPRGMLWNARLAPPWYLTFALVAGAGAAASVRVAAEWLRARPGWGEPAAARAVLVAPVVALVVVVVGIAWDTGTLPGTTKTVKTIDDRPVTTKVKWLIGPSHTPSGVPLLVKSAFGGYQRDPHWPEYQSLISTMKNLSAKYGCGRAFPEFDPSGRYGSIYADDLLPYWTDGCITSSEGLYFDSSPTSAFALVAESALSKTFSQYKPGLPYEPLSLSKGINYLHELGARYYIAISPDAIAQARATKGLQQVAQVGPSVVFLVQDVSLVQGLPTEPVVALGAGGNRSTWEKLALTWFGYASPDFTRLATAGPDAWQHVNLAQTTPQPRPLSAVSVSNVSVTDDAIHFHVDKPGVPVLVRVSYFPWWHASGAQGPYRVSPNWMVVVPTRDDVTISQRTQPVEWFALALTIVGVLLALVLALLAHDRTRARFARRLRLGATDEPAAP